MKSKNYTIGVQSHTLDIGGAERQVSYLLNLLEKGKVKSKGYSLITHKTPNLSEYEETYYLAHYESTCTSTTTKEGFITILPTSSVNTNNSYTYSFEGSTLEDDFMVIDNKLVADWDFNVSANPNWEVVDNISSDGSSSIMLNGKKLTSANPVVFETQAYNLSDLTEPAISIDFIGAAVNSFPNNTLLVSYSDECGVWKDLKLFSPSELASSGFYSENFIPTSDMIWNTAVMFDEIGSNDLKSPNVRFKFEPY